ncbi:Lrp/AsnC family transcriptional regulator [Microbispora sp. NPDC049125]|uniref:Lrp/AsnC family transcriptional regulator n=1 Tax=Microbispora sp. NPDC049125 TaxID=3154929 RepID=UPI003465BEE1
MDKIDNQILIELQKDGRLTNSELAERVNLSPSPCLRRLRQLERDRVILGYRAVLNRHALGLGFTVFVSVVMEQESRDTISKFEQEINGLPQITEAYRLFGDPDYMLRVDISDIGAYERFYTDVLIDLPGVATLTSHMPMKAVKEPRGLPLDGPEG